MANTWFCKCGKINLTSDNKCASYGGFCYGGAKRSDVRHVERKSTAA